jgi:hypothetical protein
MIPPLTTVGSSPPASSRAAIMEVVVVLPWVPPTATENCSRMSSASISARRTNGTPRSRAAAISGLSCGTAVEKTTADTPSPHVRGVVADEDRRAQLLQPLRVGRGLGVGALHLVADGAA